MKLEDNVLLFANLFREFRVEDRSVKVSFDDKLSIDGKVNFFPFFKDLTPKRKADTIYYRGLKLFQNNEEEKALNLLRACLELNPFHSDALESIGVILGRQGHYEEAISFMDKLLEIDKDSVMAHTNKSLYFMKMGKIEEAEEEKSYAAVKSFAYYGKEAKRKRGRGKFTEAGVRGS